MDRPSNPYAAPETRHQAATDSSRWNIFPAAVSFLIGAAVAGIGIVGNTVITYSLWVHTGSLNFLDILVAIYAASFSTVFGLFWMIAGRYYWKRQYRRGLVATALGILTLLVLAAIKAT